MQKHLLLTISDDPSFMYGLRFVTNFFQDKENIKLTLLYVAPAQGQDPGFDRREPTDQECEIQEHSALKNAGQRLADSGFLAENTMCKYRKKSVGTARDIIREAEKGLYDAIILGRRGTTRLEELLNTSVSMEVLEKSRNAPIWICRQPESGRKNVLLCLDGSESSLHMADHVGFMLQEEKHHITMLYVQNKGDKPAEEVLGQAQDMLLENRVDPTRITSKPITAANIEKAILQEAEAGSYAAVAAGYSGTKNEGLFGQFKIGSVSKKLCYEIQKASLWIS
ncbi:MAG: universal stress protein [Desulfohalobiaceae bacterium]